MALILEETETNGSYEGQPVRLIGTETAVLRLEDGNLADSAHSLVVTQGEGVSRAPCPRRRASVANADHTSG